VILYVSADATFSLLAMTRLVIRQITIAGEPIEDRMPNTCLTSTG
jgi:hypothetical protein